MQIVVPMSGFGERFRRAGYAVPKPLIEVEGKTIVEHVIDLYPGEKRFVFVCNRDHLAEPAFRMREILERACPSGRIVGIAPHKLGPVHAVLEAAPAIDPDEPTVVNYCDFACYWDYEEFKRFVSACGCDGAIPCYTGFHPHMLNSTNYAYVRQENGWASDIREKRPFTDRPMEEYASSGAYYFRSGALALECCRRSMRPDLALGGEYYVSMAYKPMLEDGRGAAVFPIQHFMQWGTPEDLSDYLASSRAFRLLAARGARPPRLPGAAMIPMAGLGRRFADEGYAPPKPLVPVSGRPMAVQAAADLPEADARVFVVRRDMPGLAEVRKALEEAFEGCRFVALDGPTDGQARTCLLGLGEVDPALPLTIGACDNGLLYDGDAFARLWADPGTDAVVWAARGHPGAVRNPEMYGWVKTEGGRVTGVSVKTPLSDPARDPIVVGAFTFRRAADFRAAAERLIGREGRVNGEFYVDSCVEDALALGLRVRTFEVDAYLCWGTPWDLRRFEYWQSCFHKWASHPYRLENDGDVPAEAAAELARRYAPRPAALPGPRPGPRGRP